MAPLAFSYAEDALYCHLSYGRCICDYQPRIYLTIEYLKLGPDNFNSSEVTQFQSDQGEHPVFQPQDYSPTYTQKADNEFPGRE